MPDVAFNEPVKDSVPKADDAVAVGEDLNFQRRWWHFEKAVWVIFILILLADVLGVFGRGYLAKAELATNDRSLRVKYERTERASTPSVMTIELGPMAVSNGQAHLFVSESVIRQLGNQRISPQPVSSTLTKDGIIYAFAATPDPVTIQFALEPSFPGRHTFSIQVPGFEALHAGVFVVP